MRIKLNFLFAIVLMPLSLKATDPEKSLNKTTDRHDEDVIFYAAEKKSFLVNPDFENGTRYWTLGKYNGGSATFTVDSINSEFTGKQAVIHTAGSLEKDYSDIQLFSFMEISRNTIYHISFKASVEKAALISISFNNGIDNFYEEKLILKPGKNNYGPYIYNPELDESYAFFALNLGKTHSTITLDDVLITADHTENKFYEIVTHSGINIEQLRLRNKLDIQLFNGATDDYPNIFINEKDHRVKTDKIKTGSKETILILKDDVKRANTP